MAERWQAGAILDQTAGLINCPGSPLILTEPDSAALDAILNIWARYHDEDMNSCYGHIVLGASGIYRLTSKDAHLLQNGGMRVWEATVPGVELRPATDLKVHHGTLIMRGIELNGIEQGPHGAKKQSGMYILGESRVEFHSCVVHDYRELDGDALIFARDNSAVLLSHSRFFNNEGCNTMSSAVLNMRGTTEPTHAVIKDCTFESNLSMYYGGVISATGRGSLYVTRSIFQGGRALYGGGAIFIKDATVNATIEDCFFVDNAAGETCGVNSAYHGCGGGAILNRGRMTIRRSTFQDNTAACASTGTSGIRAGGGAIHNAGTLKGEDLVFLQNSADCSGGAILQRNGSLVLTGVRFEGNYATEGGALCVDGPATPSIEAPATASAFIKHSVFKGHSVEPSTDAAAIHQRGALVLFNCSFWGQAAGGGASLWVGSGAISTTVAYCTFARGDGVQVEAAAPLLFSPFRCLGTPASVLAGPERAPVQGVCLGVGDAQKPHPHSHLHGISRSAAISLLIAGLLLALAAVVRHDATRSGRRRRRRRRRRSGGWVGRG